MSSFKAFDALHHVEVKNFFLTYTKYADLNFPDVVGNLVEFEDSHFTAIHEKNTQQHDSYSGSIMPPPEMLVSLWVIMHEKKALFVEMADEKVVHHRRSKTENHKPDEPLGPRPLLEYQHAIVSFL